MRGGRRGQFFLVIQLHSAILTACRKTPVLAIPRSGVARTSAALRGFLAAWHLQFLCMSFSSVPRHSRQGGIKLLRFFAPFFAACSVVSLREAYASFRKQSLPVGEGYPSKRGAESPFLFLCFFG